MKCQRAALTDHFASLSRRSNVLEVCRFDMNHLRTAKDFNSPTRTVINLPQGLSKLSIVLQIYLETVNLKNVARAKLSPSMTVRFVLLPTTLLAFLAAIISTPVS
jgi:hypothetical protein